MDDLEQRLEQAHLRYVSTDRPGLQRRRRGRGFTYLNTRGETIRDPQMREWIESLAIPPAWEDVWISPYKNGHILATGRDSRGRKQYRYHPRWQALQNEDKFSQMAQFGRCLPHIREVTDSHLRKRHLVREKVLAVVVRLLEKSLIRIGNTEYAQENNTYGLTTFEDDHVTVDGSTIRFEFVGKSGKEHTIDLRDQRLARAVKACQDIPGYELFQYFDEDGQRQVVDSSDVNAYLQEITGEPFTAKVFRTWGASLLAVRVLCSQPECDTPEARQQQVHDCVAEVAAALGNTKTVCQRYYLHPAVTTACLEDRLLPLYRRMQRKSASVNGLQPEEATLIALIESEGKPTEE